MMRYLSLFSGIEAVSVAWRGMAFEPAAFAETDPACSRVLAHHWPDVPNLGDVRGIDAKALAALGKIDLVVGGSPCQDLSVAGNREGLKGERSNLFYEMTRIFHATRSICGARFLLWENVPGAFSSNGGRDFAAALTELAGTPFDCPRGGWRNSGVALGDNGLVEWCVLDAQYFGLAQRRKRVFALLDTGDWERRPPVLLEPASVSGHSPPRRETQQDVAGSLSARAKGGGGLGTDFECSGGVVARSLLGHPGGRDDAETETFITHSLTADGFDASEDGMGRGTPLVPDVAPCFTRNYAKQPDNSDTNAGPMVIPILEANKRQNANIGRESAGVGNNGDPMYTLQAGAQHAVGCGNLGLQVRRITPTEAERLQGFADGHTAVKAPNGKPMADGPRYRMLGNSMAVPVMRWIGQRILRACHD